MSMLSHLIRSNHWSDSVPPMALPIALISPIVLFVYLLNCLFVELFNFPLSTSRMNIGQDPIVLAVGDHATAIGALSRGGDFGGSAAVRAVGDAVALASWVGLEARLAAEDHLVFHVPIAVGVAFEHLLGGVVDDIVAHHGVEPNHEHFLVAILGEGI